MEFGFNDLRYRAQNRRTLWETVRSCNVECVLLTVGHTIVIFTAIKVTRTQTRLKPDVHAAAV